MVIRGMIQTSLLDYPGRIAAVLFTGGCNMRCVFCHNSTLACTPEKESEIPEEDVMSFLLKRKDLLQGVVISGGEPTMSAGLSDFLFRIKEETGLPVKLDTNGTYPNILKNLLYNELIDYVAMDIKSDLDGYSRITGTDVNTLKISESICILKNCDVPCEFRTTVVKNYYTKEVAHNIGEMLRGAERYVLQQFRMCNTVLARDIKILEPCSRKEMLEFQDILSGYVPHVELRGVD